MFVMMGMIVLYVVLVISCGVLAHRKGRSALGWLLLGFLFPPVIIILLCLSPVETLRASNMRSLEKMDYRDCPYCAEQIKREACVCKHCGKDVEPKESVPKMKCKRCGYKTPATGTPCIHCGASTV